jgi:DNA-binding MarR family transcriptional regulator
MTKPGKLQGGEKPDRYESLWDRPGFLVRRLHQIHVAMFHEECGKYSITPVQFGLLTILDGKSPLDQVTRAAEIGIDRTNVADVVTRLENRGLVERRANQSDRRTRLVSITDDGRAFRGQVQHSMEIAQDRFLAPLRAEDRNLFMRLLHDLVESNNETGRAALRRALVSEK